MFYGTFISITAHIVLQFIFSGKTILHLASSNSPHVSTGNIIYLYTSIEFYITFV